ncbi:CitMHS family citrate-Mg2+:H+ or citrate-Ca2+:H+ symporter [Lysinibacillus composti]|uniref:TRAP transporter large permease subunit n=1 Tax=Lysinibacillus composti TaxID=720633 RepID=A0A3N9UHQ1_9BACI|nr:citrate:proton symporter [Lysinibacillus composti]MBM7609679.1 CitMHS family citrate-Mg2+:H+ or citrate-Ca2+:H+ symporter [Lysinibacillus composti]RQW75619.1 TRAP transporter large permease subunit [Lysinibacillus composti]
MLATLGFTMIIVFTYLIMSNRLSPIVALITVPIIFALFGGFVSNLGDMMLDGMKQVSSTAALLLFAILYFGVMIDAGLFDPFIRRLLTVVNGDPVKIAMGTAALALAVALDGDGTTTYMITVSALLPLYLKIGMNPLILATIAMLSLSVMSGMTPWGGPATRAIVATGVDPSKFFVPLIPLMIIGAIWVLLVAYFLGKKERNRVGLQKISIDHVIHTGEKDVVKPTLLRWWTNLVLTAAVMVVLVKGIWPPSVIFILGFAIALMINFPKNKVQKEIIMKHAGNALIVTALVFAAGVFTGILSGTGMVTAMSNALISLIPDSLGSQLPLIVAITSMPFTFVMSNDAYYFGVLPVLAETATSFGIDPIEIARASVLGQPVHLLSPLVASTFLLVGMISKELGEYQKYAFIGCFLTSIVLILAAVITGAISV